MNLFKRLFCKHNYEFVRNIYGDEIVLLGFNRSIWSCRKCNKTVFKSHLVKY